MRKHLLGFTNNEWSIIRDAVEFQMQFLFKNEDMGLVHRTYAIKLGELLDRIPIKVGDD